MQLLSVLNSVLLCSVSGVGFDVEHRMKTYTVDWADVCQGWTSDAYAAHVNQFADDFCVDVAEGVCAAYTAYHEQRPVHCEEVLEQIWAIKNRSEAYKGDVGAAPAILTYLSTMSHGNDSTDKSRTTENFESGTISEEPSYSAMVVCGDSGCGKTTSMCRAVVDWSELVRREAGRKCHVVSRLLGTSAATADVKSLLTSLLVQLHVLYNHDKDVDVITQKYTTLTYSKLENAFRSVLTSSPTAEFPLVLVLDSLDQLDDSYSGRSLSWLPLTWCNPHLRIVLSTLITVGPSFGVLEQAFPDDSSRRGHWFHIQALTPDTVDSILSQSQAACEVKFVPDQYATLLSACLANPTPL